MYARGILFGKMKYELGDHAVVRCPESGLEADIEFKVKGWVGGTYNAISGFIKESKTGKNLYANPVRKSRLSLSPTRTVQTDHLLCV